MTDFLDFFLAAHSLPFWALMLLGAGWLVAVLVWIRQKLSGHSKFARYRHDTIFGLKWRWGYSSRRPVNLQPFCPDDDTELVYHFDNNSREVGYQCETCDRSFGPFSGDHSYVCGMITRQIEYRLRTGEWQNIHAADVLIAPKAKLVTDEKTAAAEQAAADSANNDAPMEPTINLNTLSVGENRPA